MSYAIVSLLTERSKARLRSILTSSPIHIDLDVAYVPLWFGDDTDPQVTNFVSNGPYSVTFNHFQMYKALSHHGSLLAGSVVSPELQQRALSLGSADADRLKLIFLEHAPPLSQTNKSFLVSVSDTLVMREVEPFTLEPDILFKIP